MSECSTNNCAEYERHSLLFVLNTLKLEVSQCFNVPMFQCSNVPMSQCPNVPMFYSPNIKTLYSSQWFPEFQGGGGEGGIFEDLRKKWKIVHTSKGIFPKNHPFSPIQWKNPIFFMALRTNIPSFWGKKCISKMAEKNVFFEQIYRPVLLIIVPRKSSFRQLFVNF